MTDSSHRAAKSHLRAIQMNLAALEILLADGCDAEALGKWGEARAELDALAAEVLTAHLAQIEPASVEARATAHDVATIEGK